MKTSESSLPTPFARRGKKLGEREGRFPVDIPPLVMYIPPIHPSKSEFLSSVGTAKRLSSMPPYPSSGLPGPPAQTVLAGKKP